MINKEKLLTSVKDLPDQISMDELLDRILLLEKIDLGLSQANSGKVNSTEEAKQKLKKWLK